MKLQYSLEVFEGPLDMLLMLIAKNKLNIYDIPIAELLGQYMEQIEVMRRENMEVTSEFLEMAARLVHIKSVSLLPKQEEAEALKLELTGQLIEYQQCRAVAAKLSEALHFDREVRAQEDIPMDNLYYGSHSALEIRAAYVMAVGKGKRLSPPKPESFSALVSKKVVSVMSQAVFVLRNLWKTKIMPYRRLFSGKKDVSERVAVFLAVLELVKGKRIRIDGDGEESRIRLISGGKDE